MYYVYYGGVLYNMKRKFCHDPQEILEECCRVLAENCDLSSDYIQRVTAVKAVLSGMSSAEVAKKIGVTQVCINLWVKKADEHGVNALKTLPRSGRPHTLTSAQYNELNEVLQNDAANYGFNVWTGVSVCEYVRKTYNVEISSKTARRILRRLGFIRQRPSSN